jgi:hypothetical protein
VHVQYNSTGYTISSSDEHLQNLRDITWFRLLTFYLALCGWCVIIPLQLHPHFRKSNPRLHRLSGYTFFGASFLISIRLAVIMQRGLHFENTFSDLIISPEEDIMIGAKIPTIVFGFYFLGTGIWALRCAMQRRFTSHQHWVIRHVGAGIWVAIQRLLLLTVYTWIYPPPVAQHVQKRVFGHAAYLGDHHGGWGIHHLSIEARAATKAVSSMSIQHNHGAKGRLQYYCVVGLIPPSNLAS